MMDSIFSWQTLWYLMLVLYIPASLGLIIIVLLQKGKGVGFAGAFGMGGGSDTVFGPRASKSLPQRLTYVMAGLFMGLALIMSTIAGRTSTGKAPETVPEAATQDYSGVEGLGSAVQGGEGEAAVPEAPAGAAVPAPEAPAAETPAPAPATPEAAPAPGATGESIQAPTAGQAGPAIPPSVEAPKPLQSSPEQGTPPAVPVPPIPPAPVTSPGS